MLLVPTDDIFKNEFWDRGIGGDLSGEQGVTLSTCKRLGIPSLDIPVDLPTPEVARLIPLELALELRAVPLAMEEGILTVAMASPENRKLVDALVEVTGRKVFPVLSPPEQLEAALERLRDLYYDDSA